MALRALLEAVACQHLIERRRFVSNEELSKNCEFSETLYAKLQAMGRSLLGSVGKK